MTQEFHISVTPVGNDQYLVRTERVAPGVPLAEEQIRWPIDDWLAQARQLMNDPLLGLLQGGSAGSGARGVAALGAVDLTQTPLSLVDLGQQLYGALFQGTLRDSWVTAQGIAQHRNETLRLRLGLKGSRLPRLPWEVLYGNDTPTERSRSAGVGPVSRPLTAGTHVIFSRYQPNARLAIESLRSVTEPNQPLRVLMVIAAPTDRERLELEREAQQLQQELHAQSVAEGGAGLPEMQLTLLKQPGREQLTQALEQGRYHVLHYAGHSDLGTDGGSLYLVNRRTGLTEILTGNDLAGLLVNNHIRLAVFNSCRGAHTAASNPDNHQEQNLAETLVSRGVPAVLAMAEQIPDHVALTLTWLFYRNLKLGSPIDLSLSRARQGLISAYGSQQLYWALPILYLHPDFDGYLIPIDRASSLADRLPLLPQQYGTLPILAAAVASPGTRALPGQSSVPDRRAMKAAVVDESAELSDDLSDLDDSYEEDVSLVADLLRQLTPSSSEASVLSGVAADVSIAEPQVTQNLAPTTPNLPQPPAGLAMPAATPSGQAEPQRQRRWLSLAGTLSAVAAVAIGIWSYSQLQQGGFVLQFPDSNPISIGNRDLQTAEPEEVKTIAINHFNQQRYDEGEKAVTALLDRGELREAAEALAAVPTSVDTPEINFLWGRLAWQGSDTGSPVHTLQDARRYWELAAKAAPDNAKYQEALGFAYYAENQPLRAMDAWTQSLAVSDDDAASTQHTVVGSSDAIPTAGRGRLTTYAGIALALWNTSIDQYPSERDNLLRKAANIYEMVQRSDPNNFQVETLRRNWLWKDGAIRDWQELSRIAP